MKNNLIKLSSLILVAGMFGSAIITRADTDIVFTNLPMDPPQTTVSDSTSTTPTTVQTNQLTTLASTTTATVTEATTTPPAVQPITNQSAATSSVLTSTYQNSPVLYPGQTNTLYAQFINPVATSTALVDLELVAEDGTKIAQQSRDNSLIPFGTTTETTSTTSLTAPGLYSLSSPSNLNPGVYTWKAALFNPGWNGTIQWYDSPLSFTVIGTSTASTTNSVILAGTWQKNSDLPAHESNYLSAQFANFDAPETVLLEINLFDQNNRLVDSHDLDFITINPRNTFIEGLTTKPLDPGVYHWSIGVYAPQKKALYAWYDKVAGFTVEP